MELVNLHDLMIETQQGFDSKVFDSERTLPDSFKELVSDFDGTQLTYLKYTCILVGRTSGRNIVFPNQWFYIAAYMTDYYLMLLAYKQKVLEVLHLDNAETSKKILQAVAKNENEANTLFDKVGYHDADREWLIKFIADYSWWGGGKTIDRADFYVSPVLSLAHLVNASQSFVADICKFLAEHPSALDALKTEIANPTSVQPEISVSRAIIRPLRDSYTTEELARELHEMNHVLGTVGIHLFGLKFGNFLANTNLGELCGLADISASYKTELSKMRSLFGVIKEHRYGVSFYEDLKFELSKAIKNFDSNKSIVDLASYLRAMRTKPFLLLAGISGTGKSRIVKQMAFDSCPDNARLRKDPTSPGNYCLIEVKPNWHDSTELIGYESQIGKPHYQLTTFVRFLAKAMMYPETPFFVCLDEMNLAPVEQYFAEFLSVIESRTKIDGHIVSEPLVKADIFRKYDMEKSLFSLEELTKVNYGEILTEEDVPSYGKEKEVYLMLKENGLRIPENVVVIGTVNMDETTHQFSRKVIDRAMTIEMNLPEGDPFKDFFENSTEMVYRTAPASPSLYLATEVNAKDAIKIFAESNNDKAAWLKSEVASVLIRLNECLDDTPFKVAYRVQNELVIYFYELWRENEKAEWSEILNESVDKILMMKVLPRIEGDEDLLKQPLDSLANFCVPYPKSLAKVAEMKKRLDRAHFTSYWP